MVVHLRNHLYKNLSRVRWLLRSRWRLKYILVCLLAILVLCSFLLYESFQNLDQFGMYMVNMVCFCGNYELAKTSRSLLVNTPHCMIPDWPVIDGEVCCLFNNMTLQTIDCEYDNKHKIAIERTNFTGVRVTYPEGTDIRCSVRSLIRVDKNDNDIAWTPHKGIDVSKINYFGNDQAVEVNCSVGTDTYTKVIPLIPELKRDTKISENLPNILLLGIDSLSRLNFERHFPQAKSLVKEKEFYTLYGYNKVADNTFPNLIPLLTGQFAEDLEKEQDRPLDYFPLIWKVFKEKGYLTFYMEDTPGMNTFNYLKPGFTDPPTDYYSRPYFRATSDDIDDYGECYLDRPTLEVNYGYLLDFMKAMKSRNQKYFAFHFMVKLTHDFFNNAGLLDPFVTKFLSEAFEEGLFDDTVLVFFSDHGIRFGLIRETMSGKYEERLPFMHIHMPDKWKNENLTINEHRLTTPFDIHATLKHIIRGEPDLELKYGKSLLEEISINRSCKSIPISEHWCGCHTSHVVTDFKTIEPISKFIVKEVNRILRPESANCVKLSLKYIQSALEQRPNDQFVQCQNSSQCSQTGDQMFKYESQLKQYLVTIGVRPSNALLEATVNYDRSSKRMILLGEISRINSYANQSNCLSDPYLRKYCFCRNNFLS